MKEVPLISVIVPVYNAKKYLKRCLDSIITQAYRNIEIVLVDDGSTDGSGEVCDEYKKIDKRVRVIHKENGGLSDARNVGSKHALGEFICFVDSDDAVTSDYVEYLFGLIRQFKTEMSIATYSVVTQSGRCLGNKKESQRMVMDEEMALKELLLEEKFTISANAKMYSKSLCKTIKFPVGKLCEDNGTIYKYIMKSHDVAFGDKSVYFYHKNPDSIMTKKFSHKRLDLVELVDAMCDDIEKKYADLKLIAERRRVLARLSILRQICVGRMSQEEKNIAKRIKRYVLERKFAIIFGRIYLMRDKLAVLLLMLGCGVFGLSWRLYSLKEYR